jgi:hypothetical protein
MSRRSENSRSLLFALARHVPYTLPSVHPIARLEYRLRQLRRSRRDLFAVHTSIRHGRIRLPESLFQWGSTFTGRHRCADPNPKPQSSRHFTRGCCVVARSAFTSGLPSPKKYPHLQTRLPLPCPPSVQQSKTSEYTQVSSIHIH